jgi:hypothetical protein
MTKLIKLLQEISVSKPKLTNKMLLRFFNSNFTSFIESELIRNSTIKYYIYNIIFESKSDKPYTNKDEELLDRIVTTEDEAHNLEYTKLSDAYKSAFLKKSVEIMKKVGLEYLGEYKDKNEVDGIVWKDEIGIAYSADGKSDPGSFNWEESNVKGVDFYVLEYNI